MTHVLLPILFSSLLFVMFLIMDHFRGSIMISLLKGVTRYHEKSELHTTDLPSSDQTAIIMFHGFGDTSDGKTLESIGISSPSRSLAGSSSQNDYWLYCYQYPYDYSISYWLKDVYRKYKKIASQAKHVILWGLSFGGWFVLAVAQYLYKRGITPLLVLSIAPFTHWRDLQMMPSSIYSSSVYGNVSFNRFHDNWHVLASHGDETIRDTAIQRHYGKYMHLSFTSYPHRHNDIIRSDEYREWISKNMFIGI